MTNPLEYHVQEILNNSNYLTADHVRKLLAIFPEAPRGKETSNVTLKKQLERQLRIMERLENLSNTSTDIGEIKQVMMAHKDMVNLLGKFQQTIRAEEKMQAVQDSLAEAFEQLGNDELKKQFLDIWREKINKLEKDGF